MVSVARKSHCNDHWRKEQNSWLKYSYLFTICVAAWMIQDTDVNIEEVWIWIHEQFLFFSTGIGLSSSHILIN